MANPSPKEIQELRAEIASLHGQIQSLRAKVDAAERRTAPSIRDSLRCPNCGGTTIFHAQQVLDRTEAGREALAVAQPSVWRSRTVGKLELYFCKRCGRAEWFVKDHAEIEADGDVFREIDGSRGPAAGGYRSP
jgi:hypothetical protein